MTCKVNGASKIYYLHFLSTDYTSVRKHSELKFKKHHTFNEGHVNRHLNCQTVTWHASKYKVCKLHQQYILRLGYRQVTVQVIISQVKLW